VKTPQLVAAHTAPLRAAGGRTWMKLSTGIRNMPPAMPTPPASANSAATCAPAGRAGTAAMAPMHAATRTPAGPMMRCQRGPFATRAAMTPPTPMPMSCAAMR